MARSANALTSRLGARTDRPGSGGREPALCLYRRSLVALVDRLAQRAVEFPVAHLVAPVVAQRARDACDHAVVLSQLPAGLLTLDAARKRNSATHAGKTHTRPKGGGIGGKQQLQ